MLNVNFSENAINGADHSRIIFLHHSTGRGLIEQGNIRKLWHLRNSREGKAYEFWDHDYNKIGLTGPTGEKEAVSFDIPDDNTDPDGLEILFRQPIHSPPDNALSRLLTFDVVIFKSCFPVSAITSEKQLSHYKDHYCVIRETLSRNPKILFILMTQPPLIPMPLPVLFPVWTNNADARRARQLTSWLTSQAFLKALPNVRVFDFFDYLAAPDRAKSDPNMLRREYRGFLGLDSHPNRSANQSIAPLFIDFIWSAIQEFYLTD